AIAGSSSRQSQQHPLTRCSVMPNWVKMPVIVISVLCLCLSAFAQQLAPGASSSSDEVVLRAQVIKYFDAYARKDLDAMTALWSKDSPVVAARRDLWQRMFTIEDYSFSAPVVSRIKIEG